MNLRDVKLEKLTNGDPPCHAQLPHLEALGFEGSEASPGLRTARLGARIFVEGYLESEVLRTRDDYDEMPGRGRPRGTAPQSLPN